jgi:hypothetical protein
VQTQTCGDIDITVVGNPQDMGEMEEA